MCFVKLENLVSVLASAEIRIKNITLKTNLHYCVQNDVGQLLTVCLLSRKHYK